MHTTEADHDHDEILDDIAQVGINCATKEVIKKLLEDMLLIKPKQIRRQLVKEAETNDEIRMPTEKQLYNYLARVRGTNT